MLNFLILYEHRAREVENACLLKAQLEIRGYSVDVVHLRTFKKLRYMFYRKPEVVIVPSLYNNAFFHEYVNSFCGEMYKVVNLQYEQVLSKNALRVQTHTPVKKAAHALHLCWGENAYERLKSFGIKNAIIVGAIQMDFLKDKLNRYYYAKETIKEKYCFGEKKILLYISSFALDNLNDQEFEYYKNLNLKIDERIEITRKSKEITLKWFKQLLDENDDIIIVYRPHPFEHDDKELTSLKSDYENFRIITDFSVKQWIKVADKIFTWFSTAIIECYYAGRMCNVIRPFIIDDDIDNVMYNNVNAIDTYEKFVGAVNAPDDNISDFPISQNVITEYYGKSDEILPYMRICNLLEEIRNTNIYDMPKEDAKYRIKITDILKPIIKRLVFMLKITDNTPIFNLNHKVKKWLGEFWVNIPLYQRDEVTRDEINKITDKIKEIIKNN